MTARATINVSGLTSSALDHRALIWWGNLLLLFIETAMFGILVATYFYIRQNFGDWPPPRVDRYPILYHPVPDLTVASINLGLLLLSCIPMALVDRACLHRNTAFVLPGMLLCILFGAVAIVFRFQEFQAIHFRWNDNAYAGVVWTTLGMHLLHLLTGTLELALLAAWLFVKGMDDKHARDIRVTAAYWYWIAGIWIPLYIILFWGPRFL